MTIIYFILAVILILLGHVFKMFRWKQFVEVYESPNEKVLLNALACGHILNMLVPCRIGDLVRIIMAGRSFKNGYSFAISTVAVDLYLDLITVGLFFFGFWLFETGTSDLARVARFYAYAFIIVVFLTITFFKLKKYLKLLIQKISSIFNQNIELSLLYVSWSIIASLKNIPQRLNKVKLLLYTLVIWCAYFLSYICFAQCISLLGNKMKVTELFTILFSKNSLTILAESRITSLTLTSFPVLFFLYMLIPLLVILAYTTFYKSARTASDTSQSIFLNILPHLNANERLSFLESYFSDQGTEFLQLYLTINREIYIIQDITGGSNATTVLCVDKNENFYRKYAFGHNGRKLYEQLFWLKGHEGIIPITKITREEHTDAYCYYDMFYSATTTGLFQYVHSVSSDVSWNLIEHIFADLEDRLYVLNRSRADEQTIRRYIQEKVLKNLDYIKSSKSSIKQLLNYETLIINGEQYDNLAKLEQYLSEANLLKIFSEDNCSDIHGDLTIENIVCDLFNSEGVNYYLIDPNTNNILDSSFLDYAKLLQSLHGGYEFLMKINYVEIIGNRIYFQDIRTFVYVDLYEKYRDYLFSKFTKSQVKSIYYHEVIHWLRLLPYKIERDSVIASLFYAGFIIVLNDVVRQFEDGEAI